MTGRWGNEEKNRYRRCLNIGGGRVFRLVEAEIRCDGRMEYVRFAPEHLPPSSRTRGTGEEAK